MTKLSVYVHLKKGNGVRITADYDKNKALKEIDAGKIQINDCICNIEFWDIKGSREGETPTASVLRAWDRYTRMHILQTMDLELASLWRQKPKSHLIGIVLLRNELRTLFESLRQRRFEKKSGFDPKALAPESSMLDASFENCMRWEFRPPPTELLPVIFEEEEPVDNEV
jgi:hypothetical protein